MHGRARSGPAGTSWRAESEGARMDATSFDVYVVIDMFLLLLIGIGPKIALVPFLAITRGMDDQTRAIVTRKMLTTAAVVAVVLVALGELLRRLLHFSTGALGIASGLVLVIIAVSMILSSGEPEGAAGLAGERSGAAGGLPACGAVPLESGRDRRADDGVGGGGIGRPPRDRARPGRTRVGDRCRGLPLGQSGERACGREPACW